MPVTSVTFPKKMGHRFILRRLEYPAKVRAGRMMLVDMWWFNGAVEPTGTIPC